MLMVPDAVDPVPNRSQKHPVDQRSGKRPTKAHSDRCGKRRLRAFPGNSEAACETGQNPILDAATRIDFSCLHPETMLFSVQKLHHLYHRSGLEAIAADPAAGDVIRMPIQETLGHTFQPIPDTFWRSVYEDCVAQFNGHHAPQQRWGNGGHCTIQPRSCETMLPSASKVVPSRSSSFLMGKSSPCTDDSTSEQNDCPIDKVERRQV